jgi:hypothetical protein
MTVVWEWGTSANEAKLTGPRGFASVQYHADVGVRADAFMNDLSTDIGDSEPEVSVRFTTHGLPIPSPPAVFRPTGIIQIPAQTPRYEFNNLIPPRNRDFLR